MANDQKNVASGDVDVQIAAWAANGGATGHVSVGILKDSVKFSPKIESYRPEFESLHGMVMSIPKGQDFQVQFVMAEVTPDNLAMIMRQPAANLTGTAPNKTLLVGIPEEQYKSIKIVTKGGTGALGTRATRTLTLHRCSVASVDAVEYSHGKEQLFAVTFDVNQDTSVTSADQWYKQVDSGGA